MNSKKNLKRNLLICLLAGSAVMYTLPLHAATSVIANNTLPTGGKVMAGDIRLPSWVDTPGHGNLVMDITQSTTNGVIKWDSFDVGGSATVNFKGPQVDGGYNTLNYVNAGGSMSQIYGTINANNNGNIFIVNPAGVQIGNSAQINVGSLYVSNKNLDNVDWDAINNVNPDINSIMGQGTTGDAVLMSLGNINANNVTFEGNGRIVIDSERIKDEAGNDKLGYKNINITTSADNTDNIIIGYDAYDETIDEDTGKAIGYAGANGNTEKDRLLTINGNDYFTKADGYMWVEDVNQLQDINTNLSGNYALRNSIDATATDNGGEGFNPIGLDDSGKVIVNKVDNSDKYGFYGNFDGIDYNIFGLTINRSNEANVGLFGVAHDANINNVTLVGGSITGGSVVGSVIGAALGNTHITNATNSASVTGNTDVGGIVGYSGDDINDGAGGEITVSDSDTYAHFTNLINTGSVYSKGEQGTKASNAGGLIGYMYNGTLDGNSYNLGNVSGDSYNVGGLVGHAVNSTIGNPSVVDGKPVENVQVVYNRLDVSGSYNVGGIVGNMKGSTVQNAENSGTVLAEEFTTEGYIYHTANSKFDNAYGNAGDGIGGVKVNVANVGGIAGKADNTVYNESKIENVTNSGDVSSNTGKYEQFNEEHDYYTAGNVGGIVGRAEDTDITNATNKENDIRGAHNVGGVAGYFGGKGNVTTGVNNGGDILATGARAAAGVTSDVVNDAGFALEHVRTSNTGDEDFIIGNMGGIVGYLDGDDVYVTGSANRGTVHSQNIDNTDEILYTSQAANTGGVVGKINRNKINDEDGNILNNEAILAGIKDGSITAAVTDSYNTGDVRGYSGVGGVIGMMYNGEVAGSYNQGDINTTRQPKGGDRTTVNMGGVVGDTTEESNASAVLYNVYNSGQIGDETYTNYARHVGGVVGRLSGTVDKAYNTGAIYNGYSVVGGIAGWFYEGTISNAFNTGNITVNNKETGNAGSQVGGIAGGISGYSRGTNRIYNAYNLGTLRSFSETTSNPNQVGGIVGQIVIGNGAQTSVEIKNVYTTSNIYSATGSGAGIIYGKNGIDQNLTIEGANYIDLDSTNFTDISETNKNNEYSGSAINKVAYDDRYKSDAYNFVDLNTGEKIWANVDGTTVSDDGYWRIYNNGKTGTTPILNAFLPDSENYFAQYGLQDATGTFEGSVQYGTAYDPLLTIIKNNSNRDLSFEIGTGEKQLSISNAAGIAVYGSGLTLKGFTTNNGTGYFGGIIYSEGALTIKAAEKEDVGFGKGTKIYGSSVTLNADGTITVYGDITATGESGDSDINITSGENVDIYGTLTSVAVGEETNILGILDSSLKDVDFGNISDKDSAVTNIGNRFTHTSESKATGNINIVAGKTDEDGKVISGGNANLYFGNQEDGLITTGGDLNVEATGDVYVDSDLDIGGDLTLTGNGANSEVVLDLTNIGQVQAKNGTVDDAVTGLHNFMHHFSYTAGGGAQAGNKTISLNSASGDSKITVDMWDYENDKFYLGKYDETTAGGHTFRDELNNLNLKVDKTVVANDNVKDHIYIWVNNGEQLKNIQTAANSNNDVLGYNFALKGDINASGVTYYKAIGTGSDTGFTGTFDGRGNRIIGLTVDKVDGKDTANAGIFDTIGTNGVVKDVNIYSGNFTGSANAGAVAGKNNGRIEGIITFGNTVTVTDENGNAGGIVGENKGSSQFDENGNLTGSGIYDVESTGSVIAGSDTAVAGGLVGTNNGALGNSFSDSAVTVATGVTLDKDTTALGGVVGINNGNVQYVDSLGVTNGGATGSSNIGGIIGTNKGNMYSGFNESIVSGKDKVGGIIGNNTGTVTNIVNASSVDGFDTENASGTMAESNYVGGLVGTNSGSVTNGRNNGTITGTNYVGGMVGNNADEHSILTNLVNDSSAAIEGERYVGGIAGSNSGTITADKKNDNLINRGSITGNKYVGGVAGENKDGGTIANTLNSVVLHAKGDNAQYFGGVVGQNSGLINGATNTSDIDITAVGGTYVGGIIGENTQTGTLQGEIRNKGSVAGKSQVGGIIGKNDNDKVLQGKEENRLIVTNDGTVDAEDGGAAGIFYENNGEIKYSDISNNGVVNGGDKTGGTGGLFGINTGNITESTLANSGTVIGGGIVGGLIGKNSGDVSNSSLTNTGSVIGTSDVGGLIGKNTGTIEGGRDANDSYYKYQIYNNGTITGTGSGSNIGGLIGENATGGSLTAGYNTGAINAAGSENVGGIAGSNSGKIDQVFNTVITADGQNQTITGGTNVGGLVGNNSGTLRNAYNTTEVKGNANVGTIIGNNATNNVSNVYNTWDTENSKLISTGNSADNAYNIDSNKQTDYSGLDFNDTWKIYEGNSNPLLKVFLTNLTIKDINNEGTSLKEFLNLVYNGKEQDLNIKALIDNGFIVVPDEEALKAYHNTLIGNNLGESYLINNTDGQKTAGKHNNWLYSEQIHVNTSGEFNPNNLGYDITFANNDKGILEIDKAKLTITLDDIYRIYGQEGLKDGYEYGFSIDGLADSDKNLANDIIIEEGTIEDGALVDINNDGKVTNDVNDIDNPYKWTADVTLSDYIEQNYNILYDGGNSHVTKADLTITADNKETMPGVMPDFTGTDIQQGLVNGDSAGTYDYNLDGSVNIDVDGTYTDKIGISFDNGETYYDLENVDWSTIPGWDFLKNYDINFKPGTLIVSSELLPDIPSDWPHNRWDYLFNDAPFDRTKDFRERKAEINFVDGGMEI